MAKASFIFPVTFLIISEIFLLATGDSLQYSEKNNPNKKHLHEHKQNRVLHNRAHYSQKNRNYPQRCNIICPLILPIPQNCNGYNYPVLPITNLPSTSTSRSTSVSTTEESSTEEDDDEEEEEVETDTTTPPVNSTNHNKNITSKIKKQIKHGLTKTFRTGVSNKSKDTLDKGARSIHHRLTNRQKHILLKQLNLGNRSGKKGYKFRQINPSQCRVVCNEEYEEIPSSAQQITPYEGEEDPEEDGYIEGEDIPIEITIKPIAPQHSVVAGVRPIGNNVDFIGFDDFGANGELEDDPIVIYEEKNNKKKKTGKANRKKKARATEKRSN